MMRQYKPSHKVMIDYKPAHKLMINYKPSHKVIEDYNPTHKVMREYNPKNKVVRNYKPSHKVLRDYKPSKRGHNLCKFISFNNLNLNNNKHIVNLVTFITMFNYNAQLIFSTTHYCIRRTTF